jgi:pyridoxine 5-phosphate synthase
MLLGVNIDHIAVLREARAINDPSVLDALSICKIANADQVTIHLREDRRHIQDKDATQIIQSSFLPINLEASINKEIIKIACDLKPHRVTLVPENREEVTTEGGLDLVKNYSKISKAIKKLKNADIEVSLFIDADELMIKKAKELDADIIEIHTGEYANIDLMLNTNLKYTHHSIKELELPNSTLKIKRDESLQRIKNGAVYASSLGLKVAAGHGLNYSNVKDIVKIKEIFELNIGQSIVARSVVVGLKEAIKEMQKVIQR